MSETGTLRKLQKIEDSYLKQVRNHNIKMTDVTCRKRLH